MVFFGNGIAHISPIIWIRPNQQYFFLPEEGEVTYGWDKKSKTTVLISITEYGSKAIPLTLNLAFRSA